MEEELIAILASRLTSREPLVGTLRSAAVSVVLKKTPRPEVLLIRRAERAGDPWSGQVAFPGGKRQEEDRSARETAERETQEEVGIDLARDSDFMGYHTPFRTHTGDMDVVPAVFLLKRETAVAANQEVESFRWADLVTLVAPESRLTYRLPSEGLEVPALRVGDFIVWGLTNRIISSLVQREH